MDWRQILLASVLLLYCTAFAAAMVVVRRRTGANPRGHVGGHAGAAALNGLATLLLLLVIIAFVIDRRSLTCFGRLAWLAHPVAQALGTASLLLAGLFLIWGEMSLGLSFRVALPEQRQPLVTHGIYRFIRNPLALSADLLALGALLVAPSWLAVSTLVLTLASYAVKIRIEENHLYATHGEAYRAYCRRTGRYLPRLRRGGKR